MANRRGERWAAQQRGETTYIGGVPCARCGGRLKYTAAAKCVPCMHKANAARKRAATPATRRKWAEQQKQVPLEKRRVWARRSRLKRVYGISEVQFNNLLSTQGHTCAICYEAFKTVGGRYAPVVDHDHKTGAVRGLLCDRCNHALGHLKDNPELARRAGIYLQGSRDYS